MFIFLPILSNFALANGNLPAIIWCFASRTRLASVQQGWTFLCRQSDIELSFSRLHGISSRATVRRNAAAPFLLVRYGLRAATPARNSYRCFEGMSRIECPE
jgi:hypothetical protein